MVAGIFIDDYWIGVADPDWEGSAEAASAPGVNSN
jgi:hypothetical protein